MTKSRRRIAYVVAVAFLLAVPAAIGWFLLFRDTTTTPAAGAASTPAPTVTQANAEDLALRACRHDVTQQLKAPATARFSGERVLSQDDQSFEVTGDVDSQNSFGALIRSTYVCHVDPDGTAHAVV